MSEEVNNELPTNEPVDIVKAAPEPVPELESTKEDSKLELPDSSNINVIVPPQLAHLAGDFDIKPAEQQVISNPNRKHSPIKHIYAHKDYVIVVTEDMKKHPMTRKDALLRAEHVKTMLLKENTDKPLDERDKEVWIVYELVKACQESARQCGTPYKQAKVDRFLWDLDNCVKQIKRNKK